MYHLTHEFIAQARALKEALLLCLAADGNLHIATGMPGCVPCVPCSPYATIVNEHLSLQAVEPHSSLVDDSPLRTLARAVNGKSIAVVTSLDSPTSISARLEAGPLVFLEWAAAGHRHSSLPANNRQAYSLSLTGLPPHAVKELLEYVAEGVEFSDGNIARLRAAYRSVHGQ